MLHDSTTLAHAVCNRRGARQRLDHLDGRVEFENSRGLQWRLPIVDVSPGGLAFGLDERVPCPPIGSRIPEMVIRLGEHEIRGSFVVCHVTSSFSQGIVCGGRFTANTRFDERRLESMIHEVVESLHAIRMRHVIDSTGS
jgi:hypothetical protein